MPAACANASAAVEAVMVQGAADGTGFIMVAGQAIDRAVQGLETFTQLHIGGRAAVVGQVATGDNQVRLPCSQCQRDHLLQAVARVQSQQTCVGIGIQVCIGDLGQVQGLLRSQENAVLAPYRARRLRPMRRLVLGDWVTLVLGR